MARDNEKLDKANMSRVIALLEQEKPITKKAACEVLHISYNTTRLKKLIEDFKAKEARTKKMRAKLRGVPLTNAELALVMQEYISGTSVTEISELVYRSTSKVKTAIKNVGMPLRDPDASYQFPDVLEPELMATDYVQDDLVYSARYQCVAFIEGEVPAKAGTLGPVYSIYLLGTCQCYASQPYWELADLRKLKTELSIKITPHQGVAPSNNNPKGIK